MFWNCRRFKQGKNCDSELFCTNSLSLHLGFRKDSVVSLQVKIQKKSNLNWINFSLFIYHNFVHSKLTEAARLRCELIEKIERKKLAFLDKKSIKKEAEWKLWPLKKFSAMYFCENSDLEKKTLSLFSFL